MEKMKTAEVDASMKTWQGVRRNRRIKVRIQE